MQDKMYIVQRQIADRYAEADKARLAQGVSRPTTGSRAWNPLRVLRLRRSEPARA